MSIFGEVDIERELAEIIKPSNEINSGSLSKMRFTKIGGRWVSKDGDQTGPSGTEQMRVMNLKKQQHKINLLLRLKRLVTMMLIQKR